MGYVRKPHAVSITSKPVDKQRPSHMIKQESAQSSPMDRSLIIDTRAMLFHLAARFDRFAYLVVHTSDQPAGLSIGIADGFLRELPSPSHEDAQCLAREFSEWWSKNSIDVLCTFYNLLFPLQFFKAIRIGKSETGRHYVAIEFTNAPRYAREYSSEEVTAGLFLSDFKDMKRIVTELRAQLAKQRAQQPRLYH